MARPRVGVTGSTCIAVPDPRSSTAETFIPNRTLRRQFQEKLKDKLAEELTDDMIMAAVSAAMESNGADPKNCLLGLTSAGDKMGRLYDTTYGRLFAAGYDWMLGDSERAGLAGLRRDLVARAAGATVEVSAGTGLNLSYYPKT